MTKKHDPVIETMKEMGLSDEQIALHLKMEKRVNSLFDRGYERKRSALQADKGRNKRGHEGPLKKLLRNIISEGAGSIDDILEVLDNGDHLMVDEYDGKSLTFYYPTKAGDKKKTVTIRAIKKSYKEIIS